MVQQSPMQEFTSICINVLDVFEESMNCKGSNLFGDINCHQGPASWFDAREGVYGQQLEEDNKENDMREQSIEEDTLPERNTDENEDENKENPYMMDADADTISISSYVHPSVRTSSSSQQPLHRRHRRHDSSLSTASTVSTAMMLPSDDEIFRSRRTSLMSDINDLKLQRCTAWSQDSIGDHNRSSQHLLQPLGISPKDESHHPLQQPTSSPVSVRMVHWDELVLGGTEYPTMIP